ncbi:hypothetical protein [Paraburkholderia sp. 35.1]|uniref:hypothetical protein n=1 Tax=Paraburkholderia sp. 35.1 TaxID=2991058 RepID=UPI003D21E7D7
MANTDDELVRDLEHGIADYLRMHPNAADSVDGIRCWWVGQRCKDASVDEVLRALAELVRKGVVRETDLHDGHVIYRTAHG